MVKYPLLQMIHGAHKELERLEQTPRDYGTGRLFYASEIHTLVCIGEYPYLNLTTLAERLQVSKSAASKFVKKLIAIACIEKTKSPENAKDVLFHATPEGKRAIQGHQEFEKMTFGPLQAIESRLGQAEAKLISSFLTELNAALMKSKG